MTEAPPPCEAEKENFTGLRRVRKGWEKGRCKSCGHEYYVDGDDPMNSVAEYAEHSLHAHRLIAEKDTRIRELEGTLRFIATEWDLKPTIKELRSRAEAALAQKEGP